MSSDIFRAAERGDHRNVLRFIQMDRKSVNAQTKSTKMTPLLWATRKEHHKVEKLLLKHGASLELADAGGNTPLHYACSNRNAVSVKTLLDAGADVNAKNNKDQCPFQLASMKFFQGYILDFYDKKIAELAGLIEKGKRQTANIDIEIGNTRDASRHIYAHSQRIRKLQDNWVAGSEREEKATASLEEYTAQVAQAHDSLRQRTTRALTDINEADAAKGVAADILDSERLLKKKVDENIAKMERSLAQLEEEIATLSKGLTAKSGILKPLQRHMADPKIALTCYRGLIELLGADDEEEAHASLRTECKGDTELFKRIPEELHPGNAKLKRMGDKIFEHLENSYR